MSDKDMARAVPAPGSREPSPDGLGPSGFDPSRMFAEMDRYIDAATAEGLVLLHFRVSESLLADISGDAGARLAYYRSVPIQPADEWSWGWMLLVRKPQFQTIMHWYQPPSDRDGAEGGDANAAPVPQDRHARAEGIAQELQP